MSSFQEAAGWRPSYPWSRSSGDSGSETPARSGPTQNAWGRAWRTHIQKIEGYAERLSEGQSDLRHGAVRHLQIRPGSIRAEVRGTVLYRQTIHIQILNEERKEALTAKLAGSAESALDLMEGRLPEPVMTELTDARTGLFPQPGDLQLECTCLPRPGLCKHLAAVLHEIGSRLDEQPELLFLLRGVDPEALVAQVPALFVSRPPAEERRLDDDSLSDLFGIELTTELPDLPAPTHSPDEPAFQNALLADFDDDDYYDDLDDDLDDDWRDRSKSTGADGQPNGKSSRGLPFVDDDDDEEEPFVLSRQQLLEIGIPSSRIQKWLRDDWLLRTEERGVYEITPDAWEEIEPLLD